MNSIIISKLGVMKDCTIKEVGTEYLARKCGFKSDKHFECRAKWKVNLHGMKYRIHLYAKNEGRANSENKYDMPPPVDNELYFGSCILLNFDESEELSTLSQDEWEQIYETLFGGFEDLAATADEDEHEEDELDEYDDEEKTKEGYLKDGFVVDDDIDESFDSESMESELSGEAYVYSDEC